MNARHGKGAMPEGHNAIRVHFDEDEPPALAFNEQAMPGALVSWAWCQLTALDSLLRVLSERGERGDDDADVVAAVRSVLEPAINALAFSELRAHQLQSRQAPPLERQRGKQRGKAKGG
jgi:hypothetical protein